MAAAVAAGSIAGFIRMGEGGHFLSDVIFAAVFMALDVALLHWLVFHVLLQRTPDEAWWHDKTIALTEDLRRRSAEAIASGTGWLRRNFPETFWRPACPEGRSRRRRPGPLMRRRAKMKRGSVGVHGGDASLHFVLVGRPNRESDEQQGGER
jgi:hypothetical protein